MEKRGKVIVCLACLAVFTLVGATTGMSALVDPSFELNLTTANPITPGTVGLGWATFGATFNSTVQAQTGTHSLLEVMAAGQAWNFEGGYQVVAASPGQVFTASASYLTDTGEFSAYPGAFLQITYFDPTMLINLGTVETAPNTAKSVNNAPAALNTWYSESVSATAPAGTAYVAVYAAYMLDGSGTAASNLYWDDVTLIPEPSSIALVLTGLLGLVAFGWKKRRV